MNKKEAMKLKAGTWLEVEWLGKLGVALVVARSVDIGSGHSASVKIFIDGRLTSIGHKGVLRVIGTLEVPKTPAQQHTENCRALLEVARFARRNADSTKVNPKSPKKRTDPKLVCEEGAE